ncbi:MAG: DnaJ domain-containing protein [Oscillospiraceae bacterium]|jgi:curved DNA-binding protein|nr:DnaJ domain-containing protein [Oscillospiraceae bacterium]
MPIKDYYQVLGVEKDAKPDAIKSAYRKLAKKHHPDANRGSKDAEKKFGEINEAYEVLGNDENRRKYDDMVEQQKSGRYAPPSGFSNVTYEGGDYDWDSILSQMFGFDHNYGGTSATGSFKGYDFSPFSRGDASDPFFGNDGVYTKKKAPTKREPEELDVTVNRDLTPWDAALGTTVSVSVTMAGQTNTIEAQVPPNTKSGTKLRIKGYGKPGAKGTRGDLYVLITIQNPNPLPENVREFYSKIRS